MVFHIFLLVFFNNLDRNEVSFPQNNASDNLYKPTEDNVLVMIGQRPADATEEGHGPVNVKRLKKSNNNVNDIFVTKNSWTFAGESVASL